MADFTNLKKEFSEVSNFLIALGDEKRQAIIIRLLEDRACQGVRVNELTATTNLSRPAVSHHLKILKEAKIIDYRSEGTKNFYYLTHETTEINKLQKLLGDVTQIIAEVD
ncbi:metalloregulator ArsR/SmtB family transcription factor [Enterococcus sp. DIV0660C]|uniref:ArsR/SmtB family transcription factor n=1 Tax=Enterococcus sp. DIV0660C TaxID=2230880 RepID=UPI001A90801B|nr:metalloregulator ArsR/SmtB family transcription factor [Enterococcus sp. DIV0660C]MBO0431324.1 winged helix-turn-helix transcriptional regulator [Enterococcus sp. DIV0660C]